MVHSLISTMRNAYDRRGRGISVSKTGTCTDVPVPLCRFMRKTENAIYLAMNIKVNTFCT
jgi:hypothetical protein